MPWYLMSASAKTRALTFGHLFGLSLLLPGAVADPLHDIILAPATEICQLPVMRLVILDFHSSSHITNLLFRCSVRILHSARLELRMYPAHLFVVLPALDPLMIGI
ncbi:hypothetical protein BDR07DRAFT_1418606 [Suillus spraguei]|nr:hypothetical protein BDR07DRAFT_1431298 [Suillus spraguei]KAG2358034.1 hypothetical protein BDR07DRAFT_1418606 [Suillus spraguei]